MARHSRKVHLSQKAFVFNSEGKFLAIRRSKISSSRPLTWDLPGGELKTKEDLKRSVAREIKEEVGLRVKKLRIFDIAGDLSKKSSYWVWVAYSCSAVTTRVKLSHEHDRYRWVTRKEFLKLVSFPPWRRFVKNLT